ncbi:MAG: GNAT family N-acetyltransferase [Anaerolineae bacterium]|nr:GNAT family N-acetyltransferase [Anaerolineae bacterium]
MQIKRFVPKDDTWPRAEAFLLQREAEHNLILGMGSSLRLGERHADNAYFALIEDAGAPVAVAMCTPPYELVISCAASPAALRQLADDYYSVDPNLAGVNGENPTALAFADIWSSMTGRPYRIQVAMRLYKLTEVNPVSGVSGEMRAARQEHFELLTEWTMAFAEEAMDGMSQQDAAAMIYRILSADQSRNGLRLWVDDGQIVSMASYGRMTAHGVTVNLVYTPPERRGKGYASACVAALSQELLDRGRTFCSLYTDLANPTSNHIYQVIGYQPVIDVNQLRFGDA